MISHIHWIGDWVNPRAGLDVVAREKIPALPGIFT
jgi:hypothetical protein